MVSGIDLKFTFYSKIFLFCSRCTARFTHAFTNDYLRCTKCEVHDRVCKHIIRCMKKHVPRFPILEALGRKNYNFCRSFYISYMLYTYFLTYFFITCVLGFIDFDGSWNLVHPLRASISPNTLKYWVVV